MTLIEKMIIDSLKRKKKNIIQLARDLDMETRLVVNSCHKLVREERICEKGGVYSFKPGLSLSKNESQNEVSDLIQNSVDCQLSSRTLNIASSEEKRSLSCAKVWLNEGEEKILRSLLYQVDSFIVNLKKDNKSQNYKTADMKVIFWGVNNLKDSISNQIYSV